MDFNILLEQLSLAAMYAITSTFFWISIGIALLVGYCIAIFISRTLVTRVSPSKALRSGLAWGFFGSFLLSSSFLAYYWWDDFALIGIVALISLIVVFVMPWILFGLMGRSLADLEA